MKRKLVAALLLCSAVFLTTSWAAAADNMPVTELDTVVVTADRNASTKREVTSNLMIVDSETIENSSAINLGELLEELGFQARIYPGTNTAVAIRGYATESHGNDLAGRVLLLLNGRRIANGNAAAFSMANVERIEIIRGPAATQYGAAAMGGVVNIITKRGTGEAGDSFNANIEGGAGSYNSNKASAGLAANIGGWDASLGYRYYKRGDYNIANGDRYKFTQNKADNSFNLDTGYTFLDVHRLGININFFDAFGSDSPGAWSNTITAASNYNRTHKSNINAALNYEGASRDGMFSWRFNYGVGEEERLYKNYYKLSGAYRNTTKNKVDSNTGQAQISFNSDYLTLTTGFDYINYNLSDKGSAGSIAKGEYTNNAGFLLVKLRLLSERLIFSAGGRYDDFKIESKSQNNSSNEKRFSPSAGVAVLPFEWLKLRANYAEGFITPTPSHLFGDGNYYRANLNLNPEKNKTWEAGFDIGWNHLDFGFTYFQSVGKDALSYIDHGAGSQPRYQYINLPKAKREGVEVEFSGNVAGAVGWQDFALRPFVNLTYMTKYEARDKTGGPYSKLLRVPGLTIGYGLRFTHAEYNFTTALNAFYVSRQYATSTRCLGTYNVVNWTMKKQLFDLEGYGKIDLKAEVNNLFNREYACIENYPMPGRNFYVGLAYSY